MAKGIAINIGVNKAGGDCYETRRLVGPEENARVMMDIAETCRYTVAPPLLGACATRRNVEAELLCAARRLGEGDVLLLSFSGHGHQSNVDGCTGANCTRESWCLADERLIDRELLRLLTLFADGVRIVVVSDSCFSDGMRDFRKARAGNRDRPLSVRAPIRPASLHPVAQQLHYVDPGGIKIGASVLFIASCEKGRTSHDVRPGRKNSVFTHALHHVWRRGEFKGSYESFIAEIAGHVAEEDQVPSMGWTGTNPYWITAQPFRI